MARRVLTPEDKRRIRAQKRWREFQKYFNAQADRQQKATAQANG